MTSIAVHTMSVARFLRVAPGCDPHWRDGALCAEIGPAIFFPGKGGSDKQAKAVCAACPSKGPCLEFALDHDEEFGIFGGLTRAERERLGRPPRFPRTCQNDLHEMTPQNTYTFPNGVKACRACKRASEQRRPKRQHDRRQRRTEEAA